MQHYFSKYLRFLGVKYNILFLGKIDMDIYNEISHNFMTSAIRDLNEREVLHIDITLLNHNINLVVIDSFDNEELAYSAYNKIKEFNSAIPLILLYKKECKGNIYSILDKCEAIQSHPVDKTALCKKIFTALTLPYAIKSIHRREIVLKQNQNLTEEAIDKFFDTYEGSSLFISEDLADIVIELNSGNLDKSILEKSAKILDEVANIFSKTDQTASVVKTFNKLSTLLREIDLNKIEPQNLKAFSYLSAILSDISTYLMDMFVDRIFKDVSVFEYSLENNILFMQNTLEGIDDKNSEEVVFFDD